MLIYDCRLMNTALNTGQEKSLRELFVQSDVNQDPQALMLDPTVVYNAGMEIIKAGKDDYSRTLAAARFALRMLKESFAEKRYTLTSRDERWMNMIEQGVDDLPADADRLAERIAESRGELYLPSSYGL